MEREVPRGKARSGRELVGQGVGRRGSMMRKGGERERVVSGRDWALKDAAPVATGALAHGSIVRGTQLTAQHRGQGRRERSTCMEHSPSPCSGHRGEGKEGGGNPRR